MVEQAFKINFINHEHKLTAERVGQCIISGQFYIGDIEIEELPTNAPSHEPTVKVGDSELADVSEQNREGEVEKCPSCFREGDKCICPDKL